MADIDRPERITNITGLRAQPESPPDGVAGGGARGVRWPSAPCRLCERPVWVFTRTCRCGMTDPARDARRPYMLPVTAAVLAALAGLVWWSTRG